MYSHRHLEHTVPALDRFPEQIRLELVTIQPLLIEVDAVGVSQRRPKRADSGLSVRDTETQQRAESERVSVLPDPSLEGCTVMAAAGRET